MADSKTVRAWAWWALPRGGVILGAAAFLVPDSDARAALCVLAAAVSGVAILTGSWSHPSDHRRAGGGVTRQRGRAAWQTRSRLGRRLAHRALYDQLTGTANSELFVPRVGHALGRRRASGTAALLLVDLDDFRAVNEALGHAVGDELLVAAARRLATCLAPGDLLARLEADQFGILLERVDGAAQAAEVARRVATALGEPFALERGLVTVSAGIGVAVDDSGDAATLIRDADVALHAAKHRGRGRIAAYSPGMHEALRERVTLKSEMRLGLARGEFAPRYQPIVDLETGDVVGAEALVRWDHPTRGVLTPYQFIGLAEDCGLIVQIGLEVLRRACHQLAAWDRRVPLHRPLRVSVNLSAGQLLDPELVDQVAAIIAASGVDAGRVTLEITESILMSDAEAGLVTLSRLKALGLRLALDDFGTGFSSLSYLQRLPVDVLKVDKSFVDGLAGPGGGGDARLASAIIGLGRAMELVTTAEGIERPEQVARLRELGCRLGQGYFFGPPVMPDELEADLAATLAAATARSA